MKITLLTDNENSWFVPYGKLLQQRLIDKGHNVVYVFNPKEIDKGDVCFLLSCVRLVPMVVLSLNSNNIVVHASDLPKGKGFSPLQWQILEGKNEITLTMFEVAEQADAGPYYLKDVIKFSGTELLAEMREVMAEKILEMCVKFICEYDSLHAVEQSGDATFYRKRTAADDELDVNLTIAAQFNQFRIADNQKFPLYFRHKGEKYVLKIYRESDAASH